MVSSISNPIVAFPWYGGKFYARDFILPLLPQTKGYCEPFGGAANLMLNRPPSEVEILNDLHPGVYTFFRALQQQPEELIRKILLTPYGRDEYELAKQAAADPLEQARRFYADTRQSMFGAMRQWAGQGKLEKQIILSLHGSKITSNIYRTTERLRKVKLYNEDGLAIIQRFDDPGMLFYVDPPYVTSTRTELAVYRYELQDEDHRALAKVLHEVTARVALSGYRSELYEELYGDWTLHSSRAKVAHSTAGYNGAGSLRTEHLWTNY